MSSPGNPKKLDDIPIVWVQKGSLDEGLKLRELEKPHFDEWDRQRKFIVAQINAGTEKRTIIRSCKFGDELNHKDIEESLKDDLKSRGIDAYVVVKGGGYIYVDYSTKSVNFICKSFKYGPASAEEVTKLLSTGLGDNYKGYVISSNGNIVAVIE